MDEMTTALQAEDERQAKLHELLETIREQIRLGVAPEHRPEGLFQNIQDAVYAMRGRTPLMNDVVITSRLTAQPAAPVGETAAWQRRFKVGIPYGWSEWEQSRLSEKEFRYKFGPMIEKGECEVRYLYAVPPPSTQKVREELNTLAVLQQLKASIDTRINDLLCETKPGYDDSIVGINDAWDVVRKACDLYIALSTNPGEQE